MDDQTRSWAIPPPEARLSPKRKPYLNACLEGVASGSGFDLVCFTPLHLPLAWTWP